MSEAFEKWWGEMFMLDAFEPKIIAKTAYEAGQLNGKNQSHEEVTELKRKLFNEGVKNNSNVARIEFLEDKLSTLSAGG